MLPSSGREDTGMGAYHLLISGRVQGVGFRYALADEARAHGLSGWVRNLSDGRVEAIVQGPEDAIDRLLHWAQRGPALARVSGLSPQPVAFDAELSGFEIAPTSRHPAYP